MGFKFAASGGFHKHIDMLASNGKKRTSAVWSIGQRKFQDNFRIRKQMYFSLVQPTFTYGCEVFGFEEHIKLERVQRMYFKWTLGVAPWTKSALLYNETQTEPLHITTGRRALKYEQRAASGACGILRECIKEVWSGRDTRFTATRRSYFQKAGFNTEQITEDMKQGTTVTEKIVNRYKDQFAQLQWCVLRRDINWEVSTCRSSPKYLFYNRNMQLVARFRLQNEERGLQSWRKSKNCRICNGEAETIEHYGECTGSRTDRRTLLKEDGSGAMKMKYILELRSARDKQT